MRTYFLTTERLGFSTWNIDDLPIALKLWGDPEVTRCLIAGGTMSSKEVRERLEMEIESLRVYGIQYWPIFLKDTDHFVGCCGLRPIGEDPRSVEMGIHIVKEQWRKGLATEACRGAVSYAFDHLNAERIFAGHNPRNLVSAILLVHLGFRFLEDRYYPPTGLMHPTYILERSKCKP